MTDRIILVKPEELPPVRIIRTIQRGEPGSGSGSTDLSVQRDAVNFTIVSSSGTNAVVQPATTSLAGGMSAQDKQDLTAAKNHADTTTGNPHNLDATDVGADPAGSAAAVQSNLDGTNATLSAHVGDTAIHFPDAPSDGSKYGRTDGGWAVINEGGAGVAGSIGLGLWKYEVTTSAPPSVGEFRFNNAVITSATAFYIHDNNKAGTGLGEFWELVDAGDVIVGTDSTDNTNRFLVRVIARIDQTGYTEFTLDGGAIALEGTVTDDIDFVVDVIAFGASGGSGTVGEAPADGGYYARRNLGWIDISGTAVDHAGRTDNPHAVSAAQVGAEPEGAVAAHVAEGNPHSQYLTLDDLPANRLGWLTADVSMVDAGYLDFTNTEPVAAEQTVVSPSIDNNEVLVGQWLRDEAADQTTTFLEAQSIVQLDVMKAGGTNIEVRAEVWKRFGDMSPSVQIGSTSVDMVDDNLRQLIKINVTISGPVTFVPTDNVELRLYAAEIAGGGGGATTLTVYCKGSNLSRIVTQQDLPGLPGLHASTHHSGGSDPLSHQLINGAGSNDHAAIDAHIAATDNPHQVTYGQLTGVPTEFPPSQHGVISGHSDVSGSYANRDLMGFTGAGFEPVRRMNWVGEWANTTYEQGDVTTDGAWTMIANKQTTDRPAPQPIGDPFNVYSGTIGETSTSAKQIIFGQRYSPTVAFYLQSYRIYTKVGNFYTIYAVTDPLGSPVITQLLAFEAGADGWQEFRVDPALVYAGQVFDIVAVAYEPDPAPVTFNGNWDYQTPGSVSAPAAGQIIHPNSNTEIFRIHKTDNDAGDRSTELNALLVGDIIEAPNGLRWAIQTISDQTTYLEFEVAPSTQYNVDGVANFVFETVPSTTLTYAVDTGVWNGVATVAGLFAADSDYPSITPDDNQYGIDLEIQDVVTSPDWEVVAVSSISDGSPGSGGGGGIPEAPNDGKAYVRKSETWQDLANEPLSGVDYSYYTVPASSMVFWPDDASVPTYASVLVAANAQREVLVFPPSVDTRVYFDITIPGGLLAGADAVQFKVNTMRIVADGSPNADVAFGLNVRSAGNAGNFPLVTFPSDGVAINIAGSSVQFYRNDTPENAEVEGIALGPSDSGKTLTCVLARKGSLAKDDYAGSIYLVGCEIQIKRTAGTGW